MACIHQRVQATRSSRSSSTAFRAGKPARVVCRPCAALTAEKAQLDISKMEPLHDRVLIKPVEEEAKTAGGILLPKAPPKTNSDAHFGEVLAVGEDVKIAVKAGDKVVFNKYAMAEVEVPDGDVIFVAEKSILGTLH